MRHIRSRGTSRDKIKRQKTSRNRKQQQKQRAQTAHRHRVGETRNQSFYAIDEWFEPADREAVEIRAQSAGDGYIHPVTMDEVRQRIEDLDGRWTANLEVVQLTRMTRKRRLFPCYGMQWGPNVYLYPIEESLREAYIKPPRPEQVVEAKMYGGRWTHEGDLWVLNWTPETIRDFYLNNVLIHEIGHVNDTRNTSFAARERYANWFAIEYGYRATGGHRS